MAADHQYVLVTGTNSGLGLGICTRLIDDFLRTQPSTSSFTLIFTTRSTRKSNDTLKIIQAHLDRTHPSIANSKPKRIHLRPENVELTNLLSIRALARTLLASDIPHLNAVIFNAGIAGWSGLNWFQAIPDVLMDMRNATTWPAFKTGMAGLLTDQQLPSSDKTQIHDFEPPLGQIFCANFFGHYMLGHWLMPLLRACEVTQPARIIWVSSIEPRRHHLNEEDMQALKSHSAYEASKRLVDVLALTYDRPAARESVVGYTSTSFTLPTGVSISGGEGDGDENERPSQSQPTMHTVHPGVLTTTIIALYWIVHQAYYLAIWFARVMGAPWSTLDAYPAAMSMTWVAFAPLDEINAEEAKFGPGPTQGKGGSGGRVKWGTAASRFGTVTVKPTEVDGWGVNGTGDPFAHTWWGGKLGRAPGAIDANKEDVDDFVVQGARVWKYMEDLRREWEGRIEMFEQIQG